jgi:hypothetical protein
MLLRGLSQQTSPVRLAGERVVVGEFDERIAPHLLNKPDFRDHPIHGLDLELRRNPNRGCVEFAGQRTAAMRLNG